MFCSLSGSHATGKSTMVFEKAREMKLQYSDKTVGVITENAKFSPFPINKGATKNSQMWIFSNTIQHELKMFNSYDIVVTDRTACDPIAYSIVLGFKDLAETMFEIVKHHLEIYDEIIFKTIKNNDYLIADGVRDGKDRKFRQDVEDALLDVYDKYHNLGLLKKFTIN